MMRPLMRLRQLLMRNGAMLMMIAMGTLMAESAVIIDDDCDHDHTEADDTEEDHRCP